MFKEWSAKWPEDTKRNLKEKVLEIDPTLTEKLAAELAGSADVSSLINENCDSNENGDALHVEQTPFVIQGEAVVA